MDKPNNLTKHLTIEFNQNQLHVSEMIGCVIKGLRIITYHMHKYPQCKVKIEIFRFSPLNKAQNYLHPFRCPILVVKLV